VGLLGGLGVSGVALGATPVGEEFQVNTYTTYYQWFPSVAVDADGDFVVVWSSRGSTGTDTDGTSIQGQRYDATGNAAGSEFQVNNYTTYYQRYPSVAIDDDGGFVVVWQSEGSAGTDTGWGNSVQGRRYDAGGNALGLQFQVNTYTTNFQYYPDVAVDADGDFVVVWQSQGSAGGDIDSSVQGQRYDSSGNAVGSEFQVNTYTTDSQGQPTVGVDADGDFVVVWEGYGGGGTGAIWGQRYDSSGNAVGAEFQVNDYTTGYQSIASVAVDADGDFVVAWESSDSAGSDLDWSVQGQRYDASGNAVGAQFQVNTYTTNYQFVPSVAADANGNFVVVWSSAGSAGGDTSSYSVQGQRYDASGIAVGAQFQVNTHTTSYQFSWSSGIATEARAATTRAHPSRASATRGTRSVMTATGMTGSSVVAMRT
jgi:hypothetical protein